MLQVAPPYQFKHQTNIIHINAMKKEYKKISNHGVIDIFSDRIGYAVLIFKEVWLSCLVGSVLVYYT